MVFVQNIEMYWWFYSLVVDRIHHFGFVRRWLCWRQGVNVLKKMLLVSVISIPLVFCWYRGYHIVSLHICYFLETVKLSVININSIRQFTQGMNGLCTSLSFFRFPVYQCRWFFWYALFLILWTMNSLINYFIHMIKFSKRKRKKGKRGKAVVVKYQAWVSYTFVFCLLYYEFLTLVDL